MPYLGISIHFCNYVAWHCAQNFAQCTTAQNEAGNIYQFKHQNWVLNTYAKNFANITPTFFFYMQHKAILREIEIIAIQHIKLASSAQAVTIKVWKIRHRWNSWSINICLQSTAEILSADQNISFPSCLDCVSVWVQENEKLCKLDIPLPRSTVN